MARLSILGLYNYDSNIFTEMLVPEGIDKQEVIQNILLECAELEAIYPEPRTMQSAIKFWSRTMQYKWAKLQQSMTLEYNPIENYDRIEDYTDEAGVSAYNESDYTNASTMKHHGRIHGNIGVTTSQQMIKAEREDVAEFNLVNIIVQDFKTRFCLMVY